MSCFFDSEWISHANEYLETLEPKQIIMWSIMTFPRLFQTTAFGPSGLVIADMVNDLSDSTFLNKSTLIPSTIEHSWTRIEPDTVKNDLVPLVFLDTLYHFPETYQLVRNVSSYYQKPIYVFKPLNVNSVKEFEVEYGKNLWKENPDVYDYAVKAEPGNRAYSELEIDAVFTGRRRSQKGERSFIKILELSNRVVKINPLAKWSYEQVWEYIKQNSVPYNSLHDRGYKSIGDYHSTSLLTNLCVGERDGRWQSSGKTECGLHKDYFEMRKKFLEQQQQQKKNCQ